MNPVKRTKTIAWYFVLLGLFSFLVFAHSTLGAVVAILLFMASLINVILALWFVLAGKSKLDYLTSLVLFLGAIFSWICMPISLTIFLIYGVWILLNDRDQKSSSDYTPKH